MDDAPVFSHHNVGRDGLDSNSDSDKGYSGIARTPVNVSDGWFHVRSVIVDLIATEGVELAEDPRRVEAFLRDLCGEFPAEITVAVSALTAGIVGEFKSVTTTRSTPVALLLTRLSGKLHRELGVDMNLALWAVGTWALALGAIEPADIDLFEEYNKAGSVEGTQPVASFRSPGSDLGIAEDVSLSDPQLPGQKASSGQRTPPEQKASSEQQAMSMASLVEYLKRRIDSVSSRIPGSQLLRSKIVRTLAFLVVVTAVTYFTHSAISSREVGSSHFSGSPFSTRSAGSGFKIPTLGTYRYTTEVTAKDKVSATGKNGSRRITSQQGMTSAHSSISSINIEQVGTQISIAWAGFGSALVESDLYDWGTSEIIETSTDYIVPSTGNAESTACLWSPPLVIYKQPLTPGYSWSSNSTCTTFIGGAPYSLKLKSSALVAGIKNITVPLGKFKTVMVNVTQTSTLSPTAGMPRTTITTFAMAIDPTTGVPVREVVHNESSSQVITAMLDSFTPLSVQAG